MLQVRIKKKLGNFLLDVDFSMDGGIFAILGASGCGKSMTLKCIAGIERPDEGMTGYSLIRQNGLICHRRNEKSDICFRITHCFLQ